MNHLRVVSYKSPNSKDGEQIIYESVEKEYWIAKKKAIKWIKDCSMNAYALVSSEDNFFLIFKENEKYEAYEK